MKRSVLIFMSSSSMESVSAKYSRNSQLVKSIVTNYTPTSQKYGGGSNPQLSTAAEQKLLEQFVYFKEEFLDTAMSLDIPIPLDIVENRSQLLKPFLRSNGPKYVFQIIQSNAGNIQLLRSGISLLITTLAILRKNLPKQFVPPPPVSPQFSIHSLDREHGPRYTADEQKAIQAVTKICDVVTVPSCVSILLSTHNPLIQELLFSLIAALVSVSDDAITQVLQVPNIVNHSSSSSGNNNTTTMNAFSMNGNETSTRDKFLTMHLKRLNSRGSNIADSMLGNTNNGNNEVMRRSFMSNAGGVGGGGGNGNSNNITAIMNSTNNNNNNNNNNTANPNNNPATHAVEPSASLRYALRLDRVSSKTKVENSGEDRSEELNCCLQYLLSILLVQKNRHLLFAGYADIIIAMTKHMPQNHIGSGCGGYGTIMQHSALCEVIARSATCELPLIEKPTHAQHNHLKHLYSNQQQVNDNVPIHPLGNRILPWAGIKVPLKFLQKYYKLFAMEHDLPGGGNNNSGQITGRSGSSGNGNGGRGGGQPDKIISDSMRQEYRYAHHRTLLAICSLIVGAPSIVNYVATLSGAIDLIQWSSGIYEEDENTNTHSRGGSLAMMGGYFMNNPSGIPTLAYSMSSSNLLNNHHQPLPNVISQALQYLQFEKQNLKRLKAVNNNSGNTNMTNGAGTITTNGSLLTKGSSMTGGSLDSAKAGDNTRSRMGFPVGNHDNNNGNNGNSGKPGTSGGKNNKQVPPRLKPLDYWSVSASFTGRDSISPTQQQITKHQVEQISLTTNMQRPFGMDYAIDTEQYKLYLQNKVDTLRKDQSLTPMQVTAADQMKTQARGPLQQQNLKQDLLLNTSLQVISAQTERNIHTSAGGLRSTTAGNNNGGNNGGNMINHEASGMMTADNRSNFSQPTGHLLSWSFDPTIRNDSAAVDDDPNSRMPPQPATTSSPYGLSATYDFFAHLPHVPGLPQRIEAKDAIARGEDLTTIRKKFQVLAEEAAAKIKYSGDVLRNGKNLVSIEERARRVYSPKKSSFGLTKSHHHKDEEQGEQHPSLTSSDGSTLAIQTNSSSNNYNNNNNSLLLEQLTPPLMAPPPHSAPSSFTNHNNNSADDAEKTPAWNPIQPHAQSNQYYGLRLDNVEFEEENKLFSNFKPIFEYDAAVPLDNINKQSNSFGSGANSAAGGEHRVNKVKLSMQLEQSADIAL